MNGYLAPRVLQLLGVLLLIGAVVFWALTGRESAYVMGAAMTLILLSGYQGALATLRRVNDKNGGSQ